MEKKQVTKARIIEIALEIFAEKGYYSATTKEIARAAGVNEITLFRHFGKKETLFQQATAAYVLNLDHPDSDDQPAEENNDFAVMVRKMAKEYYRFCVMSKKIYKVQMRMSDQESEFIKLKLSRHYRDKFTKFFRQLAQEKRINADPELMAVSLISSILGIFTIEVLTQGGFTTVATEQVVDEHINNFIEIYQNKERKI